MENLQTFQNPNFGAIRTVTVDNQSWFVGKDIASALGYKVGYKAVRDHVDESDILKQDIIDAMNRKQETLLINETGLFDLMISSRLPQAKNFRKWITKDVLPAIHSTGGYIHTNDNMTNEDIMARALLIAQKTMEEHKKRIEVLVEDNKRMQPKVLFAESIMDSPDLISIGEMAKILKQNGHDIGQNRLFSWLRDNDYLMKDKDGNHVPTQKAMNLKVFRVTEYSYKTKYNTDKLVKTPKVTTKGQAYFLNKFKREGIMTATKLLS